MIDRINAKIIAEDYLKKIEGDDELGVYGITEFENGYLVIIQTRKFIESKDFSDSLIGRGPIIIDKNDGEIYWNNKILSDEKLLDEFNQKKGYSK